MFKRYALAVAALAVMLMPDPLHAQLSVDDRLAPGQPPVIVAQRALGGGFPENSLAGIEYAINRGVDMVKIDVQMTRDGRYVVMHDPTLNRTTDVEAVFPDGPPLGPTRQARGGRDYIRDYSLEDIERLRLVDGQDGKEHRASALENVLDLTDGKTLVALGLKMYDVESLAALLEPRETENLLFFDIFYTDPRVLEEITAATGVRALVAMGDSRDYLSDLEKLADGLGPKLAMVVVKSDRLTPKFVAKAWELGIRLCISGLNAEDSALQYKGDPSPWQKALDSGAAALVTAHSDALLELLDR